MTSIFIQRQKDDLFRDMTSLGSLFAYLLISFFFLILKNYYLFTRLAVGLVATYTITIIVRSFYFKDRPKKLSHRDYIERLDASSFPSLHAIRITFLSILLMVYFNDFFISLILGILIFIVVYSRIYLRKHDLKDVSAGIFLGIAIYFIIKAFFP